MERPQGCFLPSHIDSVDDSTDDSTYQQPVDSGYQQQIIESASADYVDIYDSGYESCWSDSNSFSEIDSDWDSDHELVVITTKNLD